MSGVSSLVQTGLLGKRGSVADLVQELFKGISVELLELASMVQANLRSAGKLVGRFAIELLNGEVSDVDVSGSAGVVSRLVVGRHEKSFRVWEKSAGQKVKVYTVNFY